MQRRLVAVAAAVAAMALSASSASAHPTHESCKGFGQGTAELAQLSGPFGGVIREFAQDGLVNEGVAAFHDLQCESRP
jgi:hypothetical protein